MPPLPRQQAPAHAGQRRRPGPPLTAWALLPFLLLAGSLAASAQPNSLGRFESHTDIGGPRRQGDLRYEAATGAYLVSGGGANMWFTNDALHFVWTKVSGDVSLAADITFPTAGGNAHRKACLLVRQDLGADAAYADAALHGDGLTSLQYRESKGALTREIQASTSGPRRLRIEKRGRYVSMSLAGPGEPLQPAGGTFRLELQDPFYVGLAVCAHDDEALETARFENVTLEQRAAPLPAKPTIISTLETITLASKDRRAVWWTTNLIEAPNWSRDGAALIFNGQGRLHRIPVTGGTPTPIDTGFATRCNNDHGLSPDGTQLVISDQSQGDRRSRMYVLPASGGAPRLVTSAAPSYWHGWSPDGRALAYCAERNGEYDVYTIPVEGGPETRLTTATGLDDGPEYSPDGQSIYFNSDRAGTMQIWRMKPDGTGQEPVVADAWNNWFPHPSPDGKSLVFLSYEPEVKGHPANQDVMLRVLSFATGRIEVIAKLFGGQGTINVPSWSPDSRRLAFVSYQFAPTEPPVTHAFLSTGAETRIVAADGSIPWRYPHATRDGWVLPGGDLLLVLSRSDTHPGGAVIRVTRAGQETFHYRGTQEEVNTAQWLAGDRVMVTEAGPRPRVLEVDLAGRTQVEVPLDCQRTNYHMQSRMARKLANGNYLVPQLLDKVVREYTPGGGIAWEVRTPDMPFTAIRLPNGHTLVNCTYGQISLEVDAAGKTVWQVSNADLPEPFIKDACGGQRLPNGNTVIASYGIGAHRTKLLEVTPEKRVVWTYTDDAPAGIHHFQILETNGQPLEGPAWR